MLALKCFQKMARFPSPDEIPEALIDHVRRCLELAEDVWPDHGSSGSAKAHRKLVRQRQGVKQDAGPARAIAAVAIRKAAQAKNNPADLINVAIEESLRLRLELLGYTSHERAQRASQPCAGDHLLPTGSAERRHRSATRGPDAGDGLTRQVCVLKLLSLSRQRLFGSRPAMPR
ncbi:DUF4158 domain-containing protein [Nonomuraea insulae]|uniref:DUF4158 domain-containing protein n=1 Tax=Nonomuraea insulae TaxID=1616787 RepID=A0ABW1CRU0_9ACTN